MKKTNPKNPKGEILRFNEPDQHGNIYLLGSIEARHEEVIVLEDFDSLKPVGKAKLHISETGVSVEVKLVPGSVDYPESEMSFGFGGVIEDSIFDGTIRTIKKMLVWAVGMSRKI